MLQYWYYCWCYVDDDVSFGLSMTLSIGLFIFPYLLAYKAQFSSFHYVVFMLLFKIKIYLFVYTQ